MENGSTSVEQAAKLAASAIDFAREGARAALVALGSSPEDPLKVSIEDRSMFLEKSKELIEKVALVLQVARDPSSLVKPSCFSAAFVALALHQLFSYDEDKCIAFCRLGLPHDAIARAGKLGAPQQEALEEARRNHEDLVDEYEAAISLLDSQTGLVSAPHASAFPPPPSSSPSSSIGRKRKGVVWKDPVSETEPARSAPAPAASSSSSPIPKKKPQENKKGQEEKHKKKKAQEKKQKTKDKKNDKPERDYRELFAKFSTDVVPAYEKLGMTMPTNGNAFNETLTARWTQQISEEIAEQLGDKGRKRQYGDRRMPACQRRNAKGQQCLKGDIAGPSLAAPSKYFGHHCSHFCNKCSKGLMARYEKTFGDNILNGCIHCLRTHSEGADLYIYKQVLGEGEAPISPNKAVCKECACLDHVLRQLKDHKYKYDAELTDQNDERMENEEEERKEKEELARELAAEMDRLEEEEEDTDSPSESSSPRKEQDEDEKLEAPPIKRPKKQTAKERREEEKKEAERKVLEGADALVAEYHAKKDQKGDAPKTPSTPPPKPPAVSGSVKMPPPPPKKKKARARTAQLRPMGVAPAAKPKGKKRSKEDAEDASGSSDSSSEDSSSSSSSDSDVEVIDPPPAKKPAPEPAKKPVKEEEKSAKDGPAKKKAKEEERADKGSEVNQPAAPVPRTPTPSNPVAPEDEPLEDYANQLARSMDGAIAPASGATAASSESQGEVSVEEAFGICEVRPVCVEGVAKRNNDNAFLLPASREWSGLKNGSRPTAQAMAKFVTECKTRLQGVEFQGVPIDDPHEVKPWAISLRPSDGAAVGGAIFVSYTHNLAEFANSDAASLPSNARHTILAFVQQLEQELAAPSKTA